MPAATKGLRIHLVGLAVVGALAGGAPSQSPAAESPAAEPAPTEPLERRAEHPRPDLSRSQWQNLNGYWLFRADPNREGLLGGASGPEWFRQFERQDYNVIEVPFPWESIASGLRFSYQGVAWYRRIFTPQEGWDDLRSTLVVGAVSGDVSWWLNGAPIGRHTGGYTPFEVDVTDQLVFDGENDLVARVDTATDSIAPNAVQKGGLAPSSGIWQTVYLEGRPPTHLAWVRVLPDSGKSAVAFELEYRHPTEPAGAEITLRLRDGSAPTVSAATFQRGANQLTLTAEITAPKLWRPDAPHLYEYTITAKVGDAPPDVVSSYFGLRTVDVGPTTPGGEIPAVRLNGEPIYLSGVLHHGLDPEGHDARVSDALMRSDVETTVALGFNTIRLHTKIADPRFYYWCDRVGCLVITELPGFLTDSPPTRERWHDTAIAAIRRDFNHPSIIAWTLFRDTRGIGDSGYSREDQAWVRSLVDEVRALDPTRLVDDNSSQGRDHVSTDLNTWQFFVGQVTDHAALRRRLDAEVQRHVPASTFNFIGGNTQSNQPLLNSAFGFPRPARGDQDLSLAFHTLTTLLRGEERIVGSSWCDLTDVEWLHRGLLNFDRRPKDFGYDALLPGFSLAELNAPDFLGFDGPTVVIAAPGEKITLGTFISHLSTLDVPSDRLRVDITLSARDDVGDPFAAKLGSVPGRWERGRVTRQPPIDIRLPEGRRFSGSIAATLLDSSTGRRLARNFVSVAAAERPTPRVEVRGSTTVHLRMRPEDYSAIDTIPLADGQPSLLRVAGAATITYRAEIPQFVPRDAISRVGFRAELAAAGNSSRLDWPEFPRRNNHPQTDSHTSPSRLQIRISGRETEIVELPDAPSDARGYLSYAAGFPNGIYGQLVTRWIDAPNLQDSLLAVELSVDESSAGLAVFGAEMGRFVADPTIVLELSSDVDAPDNVDQLTAARELLATSGRRLVATALDPRAAPTWKYALRQSPGDWTAQTFNDQAWPSARAPFLGSPAQTEGGTLWRGITISLRTTFAAPREDLGSLLLLRVRHRGRIAVFLNGAAIFRAERGTGDFETFPLPSAAMRALAIGDNLLAVSSEQPDPRRVLDVGLFVVRPTE